MATHDGSKYHLEAIVVMCEDLPRLVNLPGNGPGIRKCAEGKVADIIIADNTPKAMVVLCDGTDGCSRVFMHRVWNRTCIRAYAVSVEQVDLLD